MDLSAVIGEVYAAALETGDWRRPLEAVGRAFDAQGGTLLFMDHRSDAGQIVAAGGFSAEDEVQQAYNRDFAPFDPAPRLFGTLALGEAASTSRIWSPQERRRDTFYSEFYRPLGFSDTLGAPLMWDQHRIAMVALQRMGRDFGDGEIEAFGRLAPHVTRALQLQERAASARRQAVGLGELLAGRGEGVLSLGPDGRLTYANPTALSMAARGDGLILTADGLLQLADPAAGLCLLRLIHGVLAADSQQAGGSLRAPRTGGEAAYRLLVSPAADPEGLGRRGVLVLIVDPDRAPAREAVFADVHGLTGAERRLLRALCEGERLADYCRRTGISANTGKFHLSALFAKTGAHSQLELARLAGGAD